MCAAVTGSNRAALTGGSPQNDVCTVVGKPIAVRMSAQVLFSTNVWNWNPDGSRYNVQYNIRQLLWTKINVQPSP